MVHNRTWLAFANENICNHRKALKELGFVNWTTKFNPHFLRGNTEFIDRIIYICIKL